MKNLLIFFVLISGTERCLGQTFLVTPSGLRNSAEQEKNFLVIEVLGLQSKQLYDNAIKYVNETYNDPKEVIKGQIENEFLTFDTYAPGFIKYNNSGVKIPINAKFKTELRFKDEKVRIEIVSLDMPSTSSNNNVLFTGGLMEGYIIFKKNGQLFKPDAKADIENFFNNFVKTLTTYLHGKSVKDDF